MFFAGHPAIISRVDYREANPLQERELQLEVQWAGALQPCFLNCGECEGLCALKFTHVWREYRQPPNPGCAALTVTILVCQTIQVHSLLFLSLM